MLKWMEDNQERFPCILPPLNPISKEYVRGLWLSLCQEIQLTRIKLAVSATRLKEAAAPEIVTGVRRINLTNSEEKQSSSSVS